jgi:hypothetical protein
LLKPCGKQWLLTLICLNIIFSHKGVGGPVDWVLYLLASGCRTEKGRNWVFYSSSGGAFRKKGIEGFLTTRRPLYPT